MAAKRYYDNSERYYDLDRFSERSMARKSSLANGYYEGHDVRRRQELEDAGMIREDHTKMANLPQEVIMNYYPVTGPYAPETEDDTLRGVDKQMNGDDSMRSKLTGSHKGGAYVMRREAGKIERP